MVLSNALQTKEVGLLGPGFAAVAPVDFCVENVARLGLAQQEALDAPSDRLVAYVLLDGEAVLGGNHALVEAKLLVGAVIAAKEREHSVRHGPDFVNLAGLVHGLVRLIA